MRNYLTAAIERMGEVGGSYAPRPKHAYVPPPPTLPTHATQSGGFGYIFRTQAIVLVVTGIEGKQADPSGGAV